MAQEFSFVNGSNNKQYKKECFGWNLQRDYKGSGVRTEDLVSAIVVLRTDNKLAFSKIRPRCASTNLCFKWTHLEHTVVQIRIKHVVGKVSLVCTMEPRVQPSHWLWNLHSPKICNALYGGLWNYKTLGLFLEVINYY